MKKTDTIVHYEMMGYFYVASRSKEAILLSLSNKPWVCIWHTGKGKKGQREEIRETSWSIL